MTLKEAFNRVQQPFRDQLFSNTPKERLDIEIHRRPDKIYSAIGEAFVWESSPEGHLYWSKFAHDLKNMNL